MPVQEENPVTTEKTELGSRLFSRAAPCRSACSDGSDGRVAILEQQVPKSIQDPGEMDLTLPKPSVRFPPAIRASIAS